MEKKDLSHIRRIDIELQSFCNRKCDWCPNKTFDRTFKEILPDDIYVNLLHQLKDADFGNTKLFHPTKNSTELLIGDTAIVSFLGYQEPFYDVCLLKKRLNQAKEILEPKTCYTINTNGDYITKESLENLLLTNISIMDYDNKGYDYWVNKLQELGVLIIDFDENKDVIYGISRYTESITVSLNWSKNHLLENRGGYFSQNDLPQYQWKSNMNIRDYPCPEPEYYINISYDGSVMPCCHMRPDNPEHKEFILGNIKNTSLIDIYYSEKAETLREKLRHENGEYPYPCKRCHKYRVEDCIGSPSGWCYFYRNGKQVSLKR